MYKINGPNSWTGKQKKKIKNENHSPMEEDFKKVNSQCFRCEIRGHSNCNLLSLFKNSKKIIAHQL